MFHATPPPVPHHPQPRGAQRDRSIATMVRPPHDSIVLRLGGLALILLGLAVAAAWLGPLTPGNQPQDWIVGGLMVMTGVLLFSGSHRALWLHAAAMLGMLGWGLVAVGWHGMLLAPRLALFLVVGGILLTPWLTTPLWRASRRPQRTAPAAVWLGISLGLTAFVLATATLADLLLRH